MPTAMSHTLDERLVRDLDPLTEAVWKALRGRYPRLDDLCTPPGSAADQVVRPLVELLLAGTAPASASNVIEARCRRQVGLLAGAGRPQQELVEMYDYGMSLITAQVWHRGRPGDHAELTDLTARTAVVLDTVQRVVADTFWTQARADRFGRRDRRVLAHALLAGRLTDLDEQTAGVPPAAAYRAVVLRSADRTGAWRTPVSERLHERAVLHCVLGQEIVLFEPAVQDGALRVGGHLGLGQVGAGAASAAVADLPAAVTEARLVAFLALTASLFDVIVSAEQFPLELTLLQDEDFAGRMRALAEPLGMRPDLLQTVRVLYLLDLNRTRTAHRLGIARRTLSGRLARIHELTGLDPTSTRGIQLLHTALTALSMGDAARAAPGA